MGGGHGNLMGRARHLTPAVLIVGGLITAGCGGADPQSQTPAKPKTPTTLVPCGASTTEQYSSHEGVPVELNSLDVYRPAADVDGDCSGRPAVVWIHGGGWTEGDKSDHISDKVRLFTGAGYVLVSINYRLTNPTISPAEPHHPVHDQDAADAVAWLVEHADALGVDTDRIAVLGHSAGGGITAAITTDGGYLGAHGLGLDSIRCAGSIDGEGYDVVIGATHPDPNVNITYLNAFGTDPAVWPDASPVNHVTAGAGIPDFFVAARGNEMRLDLHAQFVAALRGAAVPVTVVDARDLDHAEVSVDIGAPGDTVVTPVLTEFLAGCFSSG